MRSESKNGLCRGEAVAGNDGCAANVEAMVKIVPKV
jgi:hypothetical protein